MLLLNQLINEGTQLRCRIFDVEPQRFRTVMEVSGYHHNAGGDFLSLRPALYAAGDYAHAYDEFTRSGELAHRPGIVFSRAQALRRLGGRSAAAIALYEEYLATLDGCRLTETVVLLRPHEGEV